MAYCRECGQELIEGSKFCNNCGAKILPLDKKPQNIPGYFVSKETPQKGKKPTCGLVGFWLMIACIALELITGIIIICKKTTKEIVISITAPIIGLFFLASIILSIVSLAKSERKKYGITTLSVQGGLFFLVIITIMVKI